MTISADQIIVSIPIADIVPHPHQPRRDFDTADLERLAESLRTAELMQPIGVRPIGQNKKYELVWGERRVRAARLNNWGSINARVLRLSDKQALTMLGCENLHRRDWNPVEKAEYIAKLAMPIESGGAGLKSPHDIAALLGYDVSWVRRLRRLVTLPEQFQEWVKSGDWDANVVLVCCHPYLDKPLILKAIEEDFANNRDAWGSRASCVKRAKLIASRFESFSVNDTAAASGTVPHDRTSPDLATSAAAMPPATSPDSAAVDRSDLDADATAAKRPSGTSQNSATLDRFGDYRALVAKFARDISALRKLRDMINEMIDELLATNATK